MKGYLVAGVMALGLTAMSVPSSSESTEPPPPESPERPPDQTFLTFPEWYLVFSPDEYATYLEDRPPSRFPYMGHVGQLFSSYAAMTKATSEFDFNAGYHFMIMVLATSTAGEYGIKAGYESLIGGASELTRSEMTEEDHYAAKVARDYVDFINVTPWYEFDFTGALGTMWTDVPLGDDDFIRKFERRYFLSSEYLAKAVYAGFIKAGTGAMYTPAEPVTEVELAGIRSADLPEATGVHVLEERAEGRLHATLPRYQAFTDTSRAVARSGGEFESIAGNDADAKILVTVHANDPWSHTQLQTAHELSFAQPILTEAGTTRHALIVRVGDLSALLRELESAGVHFEHVFDF